MDKRLRILVVDDEPNNLQLMMQILGDRYQLAFAPNGNKALEIARKLETDLILLDVMMPDMDGYEVCEKLKSNEVTKNIPIIFVTAKDEIGDETRGLELGAIDYITKPISPSIVKARVKNHLALKQAHEKIQKQKKRLEDQNFQLIEASRLREDIDRIVRHDLKNPLNAIIALPPVIEREGSLSELQISHLNMIKDAGLDMLSMINLSLDMFKMERGMYQLQPAKIDIPSLIRRILLENRVLADLKEISANILINGYPPEENTSVFVRGEELLCYSMLMNLIKNALEASPKEEQITIRIDQNAESGEIIISIRNKGEVPAEIRDTFFDKYVTSGKPSGTGLGTYSAWLMAEVQDGRIRLDNSVENETTLIVRLKPYEN
jgi:CheY-like chemotaxis protein